MSEENTAPATEAPQDKGPSAQDRINRLTRQKHDALRDVEALHGQVGSQAEEIKALKAQIASLRTPAQPAQPASPFGAPSQSAQPIAPSGAVTDAQIAEMVGRAVQEAVAPLTQMVNSSQKNARHQQAFAELARENPALSDPNSDLHKAFAQVWDGNQELQRLDNGLEIAVYAALGAAGPTPAIPTDAAKAAAAVSPPRTSPQNMLPKANSDAGQARELAGKLQEKGSTEGLDDREWEALLAATLGGQTPE